MNGISYVLLSDGSSDKMLMPVLDWLLHRQCPNYAIHSQWADLRRLPHPPRELMEKIRTTLIFSSSIATLKINLSSLGKGRLLPRLLDKPTLRLSV